MCLTPAVALVRHRGVAIATAIQNRRKNGGQDARPGQELRTLVSGVVVCNALVHAGFGKRPAAESREWLNQLRAVEDWCRLTVETLLIAQEAGTKQLTRLHLLEHWSLLGAHLNDAGPRLDGLGTRRGRLSRRIVSTAANP